MVRKNRIRLYELQRPKEKTDAEIVHYLVQLFWRLALPPPEGRSLAKSFFLSQKSCQHEDISSSQSFLPLEIGFDKVDSTNPQIVMLAWVGEA